MLVSFFKALISSVLIFALCSCGGSSDNGSLSEILGTWQGEIQQTTLRFGEKRSVVHSISGSLDNLILVDQNGEDLVGSRQNDGTYLFVRADSGTSSLVIDQTILRAEYTPISSGKMSVVIQYYEGFVGAAGGGTATIDMQGDLQRQ